NNNAVLAFDENQMVPNEEQPCIRCGRCTRNCPFHLMPVNIYKAYGEEDVEKLQELKVNLCMECGCCSYVCPAKRHLVTTNKLAKKLLREKGGRK
ncbi:MAG: 4Fe-4S dicluster domain-containing protein, partial [Oscillospiraceae bacterium]|nr:4Fe-4S dicluster domain-containing protein [Oscillospiraceae bacterium]